MLGEPMHELIFSLLSAALLPELDAYGCFICVEPAKDPKRYSVQLHNQNGLTIAQEPFRVGESDQMADAVAKCTGFLSE